MGNFHEIQAGKKRAFLNAYAACGRVRRAAEAVGVDYSTVYKWKKNDPEFLPAFAEAQDLAVDFMEEEAVRRAVEGVQKPVYQGGKLVGHVQEYSDTLLIFTLKGAKPERYRDNSTVEHKGNITVEYVNNWRSGTD